MEHGSTVEQGGGKTKEESQRNKVGTGGNFGNERWIAEIAKRKKNGCEGVWVGCWFCATHVHKNVLWEGKCSTPLEAVKKKKKKGSRTHPQNR